jgi:hypothetical protein
MKKFLLAALIAVGLGMGQMSQAEDAKEAPKITEVRVCPMANKAVKGDGAGSSDFKTYKVFFCCGGCKGNFDKLTDAVKQEKVDAALKTQEDAKPKA